MKKPNLYLISNSQPIGWDMYDSAVVVASDEKSAKLIYPSDTYATESEWWKNKYAVWAWCLPEQVEVTLLGKAGNDLKLGEVVCSSFNAG